MAYILGLKHLGHEVYVFDDVEPKRCLDSNYDPVSFANWEGRLHFESALRPYGVWPKACLIWGEGKATHGMAFKDAVGVARSSDLLLNVGGHLQTPDILENVRRRAFIDETPTKTQVYYDRYNIDRGFDKHHYFFTVGQNIGKPACKIPTCGVIWHPFLPPIPLSRWPAAIRRDCERFTTVSTWTGRGTFDFEGKYSGDKAHQWRNFIQLPKNTDQEMEIALHIDPAYKDDIQLFLSNDWILSDPSRLKTYKDYRQYIANSRAEFTATHHRYVLFHSGRFSDRSARYLASGKPVLTQSTGIEDHLPTGKGLLTYSTMDEAVAGIDAINKDYSAHCAAAREIAKEFVDSDKALSRMLKTMDL